MKRSVDFLLPSGGRVELEEFFLSRTHAGGLEGSRESATARLLRQLLPNASESGRQVLVPAGLSGALPEWQVEVRFSGDPVRNPQHFDMASLEVVFWLEASRLGEPVEQLIREVLPDVDWRVYCSEWSF